METNIKFWEHLQKFVDESKIIIDRPKNSCHPEFDDTVYEVDYGYLENTHSSDGEEVDVFVGTDKNQKVNGIVCCVDLSRRDSEIIILIGCNEAEKLETSSLNMKVCRG
ncbi:hypothetical protein FACS1894198_6280 [Clostridia bacterium]|nr:hypothetical protein FACS1894198_6280 [Clostridia bacterium]